MAGGGAERQLTYVSQGLTQRGWDVHVAITATGTNMNRLQSSGAEIHYLPRHAVSVLPQLTKLTRRLRPDIVMTWLPKMDILGGIAGQLAGVPWVFKMEFPNKRRSMKQLIMAIVPRTALNSALETRDWLRLLTLPQQSFDPGRLRAADTLPLAEIFGDKDIAVAWEKDHGVIKNLYGDEDKFGGVNPGDRRALYYLIMALNPQNVLEVGTHIGASTHHIARALKRLNQNGRITSVDIVDVNHPERGAWKQLGLPKSPRDFARELECLDHIDFHTGACLDLMRTSRQRYDLIFLDGDHRARAVYQEVSAALSLLKTGGAILLHDYYPGAEPLYPDNETISGPFRALERIRKENPAIGVLPLGDLPWPTKQGENVTSLALVAQSL
jgi:predicted O-methyltransferase YrrM